MDIYLHNTLSGKKEIFSSITKKSVSLYHCGPTVYDRAHIGNLRSYTFADVLRRMFEYNGFSVHQVINITDIGHLSSGADNGEDKMTKALKRLGKPMTMEAMREVANIYFEAFKEDLSLLNIELPEHFPFASDHIEDDIEIIKLLDQKGFVYRILDGLYFDTAKFPEYGALGGVNKIIADNEQSRIGENSEKKNLRDFALWKFSSDEKLGFESPFGRGFPGWHIECSAMSRKYLGQPFDIHTGGIDHIPVHHNNEIAQSEAAYGTKLANIWMHNAFLNMEGAKMAKSEGNFITLETLKEKNIDPMALRYLFLTARYSSSIEFSWEALQAAETSWKRLRKFVQGIQTSDGDHEIKSEQYKNNFIQYIRDDLDTPKAIALMWDIVKFETRDVSDIQKRKLILDFDKVLGLALDKQEEAIEIPENVQKLLDQRNTARTEKNWSLSDELREQIERFGFSVRDTDTETIVEKK